MAWLGQFIGTHSGKELARAKRVLSVVRTLGNALADETDARLAERAHRLRSEADHQFLPPQRMAECFALVREAARRTIELTHYDVQILGGAALARGQIVEMKTGENTRA